VSRFHFIARLTLVCLAEILIAAASAHWITPFIERLSPGGNSVV
jgi:hypothetical protein